MALKDSDIVRILYRTVATLDPMLDVLAVADPLGLKPRTFSTIASNRCLDRTANSASKVLNVLDWPGTAGWDKLPMNDRAKWWVSRIGLVTTGGVAFPSVFGAWTKKFPMSDYLGFASQALVLRAVGREYGITSREGGVEMLASILFGRTVDANRASVFSDEPLDETKDKSFMVQLWQVGRTLVSLARSLDERPGSPRILSMLSWIPLIGAPASYLGETIALRRAAKMCREWIVAHPDAITVARV
ncbi:hypothetical protein [Gordonia sp. (in: high G+C Gram-positive bacteria)]|uniref:hypothetical protein n=1 Tax=Gordonia sp. (in: high G+C Gram-positive bacteria) TaxID=84139 RepID=UPI003C771851